MFFIFARASLAAVAFSGVLAAGPVVAVVSAAVLGLAFIRTSASSYLFDPRPIVMYITTPCFQKNKADSVQD
jgi:hypothetical protein